MSIQKRQNKRFLVVLIAKKVYYLITRSICMNNLGNKEVMSNNIRYYLKEKRKTRKQLCQDLNIAYSTFTDWCCARKYPRIDKIELMANYFGIEKSDLIEDKSDKERLSERHKRIWDDIVGEAELTDDEVKKIALYAKFIISERK